MRREGEGGEEEGGERRRKEEGGRVRVPRYSLLVRDLMKATDTDHKDYGDLR
jgi:hypothetical protein